ncbi:hypothetical protein GCM10011390_11460 [Aureimonas endophytica]|uniref:SpoVT-AbrB domain-containing protein n=1 Tax=Aureimonas endophytica TaxID=2027858 RepID=A0A916ZFQ5_9HYPH|nr:AbrB/MazE/SpoVT family DNA-binding domain-containing protein [Aureimonas endophytica]GGD94405.1 hypothetical protein GCM10011390_11460 [Aureimonas endophytica]
MRVTEKGQVTIPKAIRDKLGIGPGSEVEFVDRGDRVILQRRPGPSGEPSSFDEWAAGVAGAIETMGMDGKEYVDWLRGPRDDLDPH